MTHAKHALQRECRRAACATLYIDTEKQDKPWFTIHIKSLLRTSASMSCVTYGDSGVRCVHWTGRVQGVSASWGFWVEFSLSMLQMKHLSNCLKAILVSFWTRRSNSPLHTLFHSAATISVTSERDRSPTVQMTALRPAEGKESLKGHCEASCDLHTLLTIADCFQSFDCDWRNKTPSYQIHFNLAVAHSIFFIYKSLLWNEK